jgi:hypothetical protein
MLRNSWLLALFQVALMSSVGAQFWLDRITRPRAWVATEPVDPALPIRGRYLSLRAVLPLAASVQLPELRGKEDPRIPVTLRVKGNRLLADSAGDGPTEDAVIRSVEGVAMVALVQPLALFIPPDVKDPSIQFEGDMLWVEVTLPRLGSPRPIQLGHERQGRIEPLSLR